MKRIVSFALLICFLSTALFSADNREFRATWSITWEQFDPGLSTEALKARTRAILDKHVEAGMNAVVWQIRQNGTVYYPSAFEPWGSYLGHSDPGYDPLAYAIEEAHKRGMELHAWFNTFHTSSTLPGTAAIENPDWVCRDGSGNPMRSNYCLSPGLKAVRDYTLAMVVEIINNYDIDGIHFDYIRWSEYNNSMAGLMFMKQAEEMQLPDAVLPPGMPEYLEQQEAERISLQKRTASMPDNRYIYDIEHPEGCPIPDSTELYPNAGPGAKFASMDDWRRATLNVFIKAAHDTVQALKPWVRVSPAAIASYRSGSWNGYSTVFQDAALWYNEGWIDQLSPMNYHYFNGAELYNHIVNEWQPYISKGMVAGRPYISGVGSFLISEWDVHYDIIESCRTLPWLRGFQFFSYRFWDDSYFAFESSHSVFSSIAKQPTAHFLNADVPPAPSISLKKNSDTSYMLEVTPDASVNKSQWFVIYRSKNANIDPDNDEIIKVVFADSAFTHDLSFDGLQLSDKYYYGASMSSRYWIESVLSNVLATDVLARIPPHIVESIPANNAVNVPNNQIVELHFNKSMDAASLEQNFSVSPDVSNLKLTWKNPTWLREDHQVLYISASWEFETTYTLTLGASTLDRSGMQIDGNADGVAGDAYSLSFTISPPDEEAPIILSTVPAQGDYNVDVDGVVTLQFNELLNLKSLKDKFSMRYAEGRVFPTYSIFVTPDLKTHLTLKPNSSMASGADVTLHIEAGISDTTGNEMAAAELNFHTDNSYYSQRKMIDNFGGKTTWENPGWSGATYRISDKMSYSRFTDENYVPGPGSDKSSLCIHVVPEAEDWFARVYCGDLNSAKDVDTSMAIQIYVFGDGSNYEFRIALQEYKENADRNYFEVSKWFKVDWMGWRLIEWDLKDPKQFGKWGNMTDGRLDKNAVYSVNSLHLQGNPQDPLRPVSCYVDQLRSVKRHKGIPPKNLPPRIEPIADAVTMSGVPVYINVLYSDPNPDDNLTFTLLADTSVFMLRYYPSLPGRVRILPRAGYLGSSRMLAIVRDDGIGELADTAAFNLTVLFNSGLAAVPETFKVYPNYPNPFNPHTTLHFDLPSREHVSIEIFDIRGRRVGEILNSKLQPGSYHVKFDASFLSSGLYFYKITAGSEIYINRMTLLK